MKRALLLILCLCLLLPAGALAAETCQPGDSGAAVTQLQRRLIELGLLSGKADGIYGKQTSAAVTEAQRLLTELGGHSLTQDGVAGRKTVELLFDENNDALLSTLCTGSRGERVRALQNRLIDLRFLHEMADGAFGSSTKAAVTKFQAEAKGWGIFQREPDGLADPDTVRLLNVDLSSYGWQAPEYYDFTRPDTLNGNYLFSKSCILMDGPSGEVLFESASRERRYPASTTKILTLMVALESGGLEDIVTIPQEAADVPADSSLVPVTPGEQMRKLDLLYGLMIRSGNDAANAVAVLEAGSVEAFVERMNEKAAQIGMGDSHFANPHGYHDEEHYTTAYDLALLARAGMSDPDFCRIVTCLSYTLPPTSKRDALTLRNEYEIFDPASELYLPYAAGIKSGYTSRAGFCYVGAAQQDGRSLIAVVLGAPSRNRAWKDLQKLFEYGFSQP